MGVMMMRMVVTVMVVMAGEGRDRDRDHHHEKQQRQQLFHGRDYSWPAAGINYGRRKRTRFSNND